ncbi:MAG: glycosyltransferase [Prevotellaceae bacterium]|nr:glycosyltransferase [Prevotellaceae bacterium]
MKVALHTVDLFPGRERLMPFRTILEVAKVMVANGWEADILNSSVSEADAKDFEWQGIRIVQCPRNFRELSEWVNDRHYDVFFFAATIREGLKDLSGLGLMNCRKIAYIPSGITPKWNALWMMRQYGMYAKAWVLEALAPKTLLAKKLKKVGFSDIIGLTEYTSQSVGKALRTHTIYPGKDDFEKIQSDNTYLQKHGLQGKKFYLFTGGPAPSRGGVELLQAFDRFTDNTDDALLVFLVRQDVGGEYNRLTHGLEELKNRNKVMVLKDRLSVAQLKAYFEAAYAVVLPFLCIPAEIPLTYYEVLSCGTPVVSFANAGTTAYLHQGLKLAGKVGVGNLSHALIDLWANKNERDVLAVKALGIMEKHLTWEEVGKEWMKIIGNDK